VLPVWFTAMAEEVCRETLNKANGAPLAERVAQAVELFDGLGITLVQLETKVGRKRDRWTADHVTTLGILFNSLRRNEIVKDDAFPPARITSADVQGQQEVA